MINRERLLRTEEQAAQAALRPPAPDNPLDDGPAPELERRRLFNEAWTSYENGEKKETDDALAAKRVAAETGPESLRTANGQVLETIRAERTKLNQIKSQYREQLAASAPRTQYVAEREVMLRREEQAAEAALRPPDPYEGSREIAEGTPVPLFEGVTMTRSGNACTLRFDPERWSGPPGTTSLAITLPSAHLHRGSATFLSLGSRPAGSAFERRGSLDLTDSHLEVRLNGEITQWTPVRFGAGRRAEALAAVRTEGWKLGECAPALRRDKQLVLAAVSHYGLALAHADPVLQNDEEVARAAVTANFQAFRYASTALRNNRRFVLHAVELDTGVVPASQVHAGGAISVGGPALSPGSSTLRIASDSLRRDPVFVRDVQRVNPRAVRHALVEPARDARSGPGNDGGAGGAGGPERIGVQAEVRYNDGDRAWVAEQGRLSEQLLDPRSDVRRDAGRISPINHQYLSPDRQLAAPGFRYVQEGGGDARTYHFIVEAPAPLPLRGRWNVVESGLNEFTLRRDREQTATDRNDLPRTQMAFSYNTVFHGRSMVGNPGERRVEGSLNIRFDEVQRLMTEAVAERGTAERDDAGMRDFDLPRDRPIGLISLQDNVDRWEGYSHHLGGVLADRGHRVIRRGPPVEYVTSDPIAMLRQRIIALRNGAPAVRDFVLCLTPHGSSSAMYFQVNATTSLRVDPADFRALLDDFPDCRFTNIVNSCHGGGFDRTDTPDLFREVGEPGRITTILQVGRALPNRVQLRDSRGERVRDGERVSHYDALLIHYLSLRNPPGSTTPRYTFGQAHLLARAAASEVEPGVTPRVRRTANQPGGTMTAGLDNRPRLLDEAGPGEMRA
jgi:hypothetical protein